MPLGLLLAAHISGRVSMPLAGILGFGSIGVSIAILAILNRAVDRGAGASAGITADILGGGGVYRGVLSVLLSTGCCLAVVSVSAGNLMQLMKRVTRQADGTTFVVSAVAAMLMPLLFVQVRCQHGWKRFDELIESTRIGEARSELLIVLRLAPNSSWRGRSVAESFREVQAEYDRIEQARQQLPHPPDDFEGVLRQARYLAILGERDLALSYLEQFPVASQSVGSALLRGTIFETRRAWREAIAEYVLGQKLLKESGDSLEPSQEWRTALRGEGFCRRKAGDLHGAEQAYLKLMRAAPSGSSALLLAHFYEDTQQTSDASRWLREAVRLDPTCNEEAERLWDKLTTSHFGCFQAHRQRRQGR